MSEFDRVRIGVVSISDRASAGVYEDKGIPALKDWLTRALRNPIEWQERLIPDEQAGISATLVDLVDTVRCDLVLTTGGHRPRAARRDAGSDAGHRAQGNAGIRRADAADLAELRAHRHPV